ncbi:cytochrome P450 [Micromonospora sp. NPDC049559]|uniref:cytochrome P450 n=1 Tax=Micromonospora sp. NPDC049559 TaxID=3155923 RepID=UPI00343A9C2A
MRDLLRPDPIRALARPDVLPDPYPAYAWLRRHQPVFWYAPLDSWVLTRHEDCVTVFRDGERFGADWRRIGEELPPHAVSIQTVDPPEHTSVRRLVMSALREQDAEATAKLVRDRTEELLGRLAARPSFDFVTEFAEPLALATIAAFLGVPEPEGEFFVPAANAITDGMDAGLWPERGAAAARARIALGEMIDGWFTGGGATGMGARLAARATETGVDRLLLANTLRVLLHAGYASAAKLLSLGAATLLAEPGGLARWTAADEGLAVEELVRHASPVQAMARACVRDMELGGVTVRAGQAVTLLLGSANRDAARFAAPDALLLDRRPNPHLGFGRGAHSCLGSPFAVTQAKAVFGAIARDHPSARLVGTPVFRPNLTLRGLARLEVSLR